MEHCIEQLSEFEYHLQNNNQMLDEAILKDFLKCYKNIVPEDTIVIDSAKGYFGYTLTLFQLIKYLEKKDYIESCNKLIEMVNCDGIEQKRVHSNIVYYLGKYLNEDDTAMFPKISSVAEFLQMKTRYKTILESYTDEKDACFFLDFLMDVIRNDLVSSSITGFVVENETLPFPAEFFPRFYDNEYGETCAAICGDTIQLDFSKDHAIVDVWNCSGMAEALSDVKKSGFVYDEENHFAYYYEKLRRKPRPTCRSWDESEYYFINLKIFHT